MGLLTETRKELLEKYEWLVEQHNMGTINLNNWEEDFLSGDVPDALYAKDGFLTSRQIDKLEEIYDRYINRC